MLAKRPTIPGTTKVAPTISNTPRPAPTPVAQASATAAPSAQAVAPKIAPRAVTATVTNVTPEAEPQHEAPLVTQDNAAPLVAPDFMKSKAGKGLEELQQFVRPPRIKIIQGLTDNELKSRLQVGIGDIIVSPNDLVLVQQARDAGGNPLFDQGETIYVTPLFFWVEFVKWNDVRLKGTAPAILERSLDERSGLAALCRSKNTWKQPHPNPPLNLPDAIVKNVETLCFLVYIHGVDGLNEPVVLTFNSGDHAAGRQACALIKARKDAPIYGNIFGIRGVMRSSNNNNWPGINFINPDPAVCPAFIEDEATFMAFEKLHEEYAEAHQRQLLTGVDDTDVQVAPPAETGNM